jgi:hypothetical protein
MGLSSINSGPVSAKQRGENLPTPFQNANAILMESAETQPEKLATQALKKDKDS